jgi:hypothetical protein
MKLPGVTWIEAVISCSTMKIRSLSRASHEVQFMHACRMDAPASQPASQPVGVLYRGNSWRDVVLRKDYTAFHVWEELLEYLT